MMRVLIIPFPGMPAAAQEKLRLAAASIPECSADLFSVPSSVLSKPSRRPAVSQKVAFRQALDQHYDLVICCDAETKSPDVLIPALAAHFARDANLDAVLATAGRDASLWRRTEIGALTFLCRWVSDLPLRGWMSPYRAFRTKALARIAFELNANEVQFETEVLLQLFAVKASIQEIHVDTAESFRPPAWGWSQSIDILKAVLRYRLQQVNLFYDFRFHPPTTSTQTGTGNHAH